MLFPVIWASNPTVSNSSVTVQYCRPTTAAINVTLFPNQQWNGNVYSESGSYITKLLNSKGCDSIIVTNVTVLKGTLQGKFTVEAGKQVWFSSGNLQYQAKAEIGDSVHVVIGDTMARGIWRFAEHQYDIVGKSNIFLLKEYQGWIDLFAFGTSGYNGKYPYLISTTGTDYTTTNLNTDVNYDWGMYNSISNGGNHYGLWFTPTYSHMQYILFSRPRATMLHSVGTVENVRGLILLPDDWMTPESVSFTPQASNYTINKYSANEWNIMESQGAVFLPSAGYRSATVAPTFYPDYIQYWTATASNTSAYRLYMDNGASANYTANTIFQTGTNYYGRAVRLVRWVQ